MTTINSLEQPKSAGVFEDLSVLGFSIQEQNSVNGDYRANHSESLPYIIYFKDKEDGNFGIPIPNSNENETYYKKYLETILFELLEEVEPSFLFNDNRFIKICCTHNEKEKIRKSLISNKASENTIVYSVSKLKIKQIDENTVMLKDSDSLVEDFVDHSRFKELVFRMENAGFEYFKDDLFKYTNQKVENIEAGSQRFYSLK